MTRTDPSQSRALTALVELVRKSTREPSARELHTGHEALQARVARDEAKPQARVARWLFVGVAACIALAGSWVLLWPDTTPAQSVEIVQIEGGKLLEGGYLAESGNAGVQLRFNEGSRFELMPGARGRLRGTGREGAQFAIERGAAALRITPAHGRSWSVEAGPFLVKVTGTQFTVAWDPTIEQFDLDLQRGQVVVSGPMVGEDLSLRQGQRLRVSLPKAETVISEPPAQNGRNDAGVSNTAPLAASNATPLNTEPTTSAPVAASNTSGGEPQAESAPALGAALPKTGRGWREAMANGQWDRILADVDREGVSNAVASLSSDELFALTDAARYRRRADVARAALLAHRQRFPNSPRSVQAMFLLGRVEELRSGGATGAIQWYDEYLKRVPAGAYSAEALGRKMILWKELHGATSARKIAEQYLRRFPEGSYAGAAQALLGTE